MRRWGDYKVTKLTVPCAPDDGMCFGDDRGNVVEVVRPRLSLRRWLAWLRATVRVEVYGGKTYRARVIREAPQYEWPDEYGRHL